MISRKWLVAGLAAMLTLSLLLTGCGNMHTGKATTQTKHVNLIYYTVGEPDKDLSMVNDKINGILLKKLGVTITYIKIGWQAYDNKMLELTSSGAPFDIIYADNYATYAQKGAWLCLDDYLKNEGKQMAQAIDPTLWKGVRMMDGKIYGVPTNKELADPDLWMYPKSLVYKYKIDIRQYTTLESLEPLLEMIKENEPGYQVMELDKDSSNFFALCGYEYLTNKYLPLMVKSESSSPTIVNIFDTPEAKSILYTLRQYYQAGYINADAATRSSPALEAGKKVFWRQASGGPYAANIWSQQRGYTVVTQQVTKTVVTTESTRGGVMAVNAQTKYPSECVAFLNLLNTDAQVRDLFNYGIEGVHYTLNGKGQVVPTKRAQDYSGVQYTQGNWFILKTQGGNTPDPLDKWEQYKTFNKNAVTSRVFGFTPDLSDFTPEAENIQNICKKYYPCLMTGSVDVNVELPKFQNELEQAGISQVRASLQRQLDAWLGTNK